MQDQHFPRLAEWYRHCLDSDEAFRTTAAEILEHFEACERAGQFESILAETHDPGFKWKYP